MAPSEPVMVARAGAYSGNPRARVGECGSLRHVRRRVMEEGRAWGGTERLSLEMSEMCLVAFVLAMRTKGL